MKIVLFIISLTILFIAEVFSQDRGLQEIRSGLQGRAKQFPSEKLYVHTDKSFYTAGEILWFKIYRLTDSVSNAALSSKVAYVDILDEQNAAIAKAKISLDEKGGDGSIELPLTLASGYYRFRAYTAWMKNFGPEGFFQKKITLVNPFKSTGSKKDSVRLGRIDLFPEGGDLVNGLPSQLGFKIQNNGKEVAGKGYVVDEQGDTLLRFAPHKFGMGSFNLTPNTLHHYKAIFVFDDNSVVVRDLPQVLDRGYVMHVEEESQGINVTVRTNFPSPSPDIFLIAQNRQVIKSAKQNSLANDVTFFSINKSELGPGISQITVFNSERQPVCERLFFNPPLQKKTIAAKLSKQEYHNRDKVALALSADISAPAELSVSVYQLDSLQLRDLQDISTYVYLESELTGEIENPLYYLSGTSEDIKKAADHLMLTQGWRRFNRKENFTSQFLPESLGQVITARVTDVATNLPVKDLQVNLSIPETSYKLFSGFSDDSGIVRIRTTEFFGRGELVLQAANKNNNYKIEVINPFAEQYSGTAYPALSISSAHKNLLENYSIAMQSQHIYSTDSIQQFLLPGLRDTFPFYGKPDYSYQLDNYKRFTTMEEVLREYVREISVGVRGTDGLNFKLLNEMNREFYTDNILVTVDGVPVPNPDKIFGMDPLKVRRIDIIPRHYVLGTSVFYGLASFLTYKEDHEGIDIDPKAVRLDYEGLHIRREFYSPDYSAEGRLKSRIPDLRNTLFWSPQVTAGQAVEFYTGDNKGRYLIVVQGLTNTGDPISVISELTVK